MEKLKSILIAAVSTLVMTIVLGCGSGAKIVTTVPAKEEQPRPVVNRHAFGYYVRAVLAEKEQQFPAAVTLYQEALKHSPGNSEILYALAQLYFNLRQFGAALETARQMYYKNAESYLLMADCHRVLREDADAEATYRKALRLDPNGTHAHWYVANYARNRGDYDDAVFHLSEVARVNPSARIYSEIAAVRISQREFDEAIAAFRRSIEIDPSESNLQSYVSLAILLRQGNQAREAEETLLRGLRQNPGEPMLLVYLAEMYAETGDTVKAMDRVREIQRFASDDLQMVNRAAQVAFELDNLELADSLFEYELSRLPMSVLANYYRGQIAVLQDRPEDAKTHFWKLIEVADSLPDGYINLGMLYLNQDSLDLAIEVLTEGVLRATQGREEAQFYLSTALGRAERYDDVIPIAESLVSNYPDRARFMFLLGSALERTKQYDSAAVVFQRVLEIDSDHAQTLNYLGYMWADLGVNLDESLQMILRALEIDGDNPAYLDSYGWVLYKLGRYEEAETQIRRAIELMQDEDYILYDHLADVYSMLGRHEEARANWEKALELDPDNSEIREKLAR